MSSGPVQDFPQPSARLALSGLRPGTKRALLAALATAVTMATGWSIAANVWATGYFGDTDDALRLVQVRDFLTGQGWYDLHVHRLNPPEGLLIHWSRIVDVPLAFLIRVFGMFLAGDTAELAARLAFPAVMMAALFFMLARAADTLMGGRAIVPAMVLCALTGIGLGQFQPGRIDHHAPQIVLLVSMLALLLDSLAPGRGWRAAGAGVAAAVSLGISVENLPFIVTMSAILPAIWTLDGASFRKPLLAYGTGLVAGLVAVFLITIPPARWGVQACDAFSLSYAVPALTGALLCIVLGAIAAPASQRWRLFLLLLASGVVLVTLPFLSQCLRGPLEAVDPLLKRYWLDNVYEARPLLQSLATETRYTAMVMLPPILCAILTLAPLASTRGQERRRWAIVTVFAATGVLTTFWQIRAASSLAPLSVLAGAWLVLKFRERLEVQKLGTAAVLSLALALPLTSVGWAIGYAMLPVARPAAANADGAQAAAANCFASSNYADASKLEPGLVVAPIDVGAHMLALTQHSVLAAAYHRNNRGNRAALDILFAEPAIAEKLARDASADYVGICMGKAELGLIRKFAPQGLAIRLAAGETPSWLEEATPSGAHLRLFRVRPRP